MKTCSRLFGALATLVLSNAGCIVIANGGWCLGCSKTVWTETETEQLALHPTGLRALEVRTHNGSINFQAQPADSAEAFVTVSKKAGGRTPAEAQEALEALEVFVEPDGDGTQRIGWRWRGVKRPSWRQQVSFDILAPGNIRFDGKTHNGPVEVRGISGDVRVVTHNGRIDVESADGKLYARTHNGPISATYTGDDVTLKTHNGRVVADFNRCRALDGSISTHNGGVKVIVGDDASFVLEARTHNGAISCQVPLTDSEASRRKLTGRIGDGEGSLAVTTHNGSVRFNRLTG